MLFYNKITLLEWNIQECHFSISNIVYKFIFFYILLYNKVILLYSNIIGVKIIL